MKTTFLENVIGYKFKNKNNLKLALNHRSISYYYNNERMEFLGDSLITFIIGEALLINFPEFREGFLSKVRADLVQSKTLAKLSNELKLGKYINFGLKKIKLQNNESILADTMEALIGAIYLDGGVNPTKKVVLSLFRNRLKKIKSSNFIKDPKTKLQEYLQYRQIKLPIYEIIYILNGKNEQNFLVKCCVEKYITTGIGYNRRNAEQKSANSLLKILNE
ncbi:ribonuclease III [Candidatus Portiera aleyrodidarum]|uniref:Ribonuclease 3 n=1 Tax=Candidatus Portiera aleyrodidarum TaxID=91844 RepID=A0A8D9NAZ9_9GAMM|nr:ribonuclease III [Candidatus Portiera aleyrodidarum]CEI58621.1 Ribonuclease 3 [Candidatus Portiera aleyrodidarum]